MVLEQSERSGEVFAERCEGDDDGGLLREGRKEKGEGEREQWLVRKREGAPGSKTGLPLKHCSLSFASLRELTFSSPCLSLLPAPSSLAAWP